MSLCSEICLDIWRKKKTLCFYCEEIAVGFFPPCICSRQSPGSHVTADTERESKLSVQNEMEKSGIIYSFICVEHFYGESKSSFHPILKLVINHLMHSVWTEKYNRNEYKTLRRFMVNGTGSREAFHRNYIRTCIMNFYHPLTKFTQKK